MDYEWDEAKHLANLRKHGIDFQDVPAMFDGDLLTVEDNRYSYGEARFCHVWLITRKSNCRCPYSTRRLYPNYFCKKGNEI